MSDSLPPGCSIVNIFEAAHVADYYPGSEEEMSRGLRIGDVVGISRVGIHSEVLSPGCRTSWPHAEKLNDEFVLVISGSPTLWVDGYTRTLRPGDAVGLPSGTGLCHTFINDSPEPAQLLVVGERNPENRTFYCFEPRGYSGMPSERLWPDASARPLGPHPALPRVRKG